MSAEEYQAVTEVRMRAWWCLLAGAGWMAGAVAVFVTGFWLTLRPLPWSAAVGLSGMAAKGLGLPLIFMAILLFERAVAGFRRTRGQFEEAARLQGQFSEGGRECEGCEPNRESL